MHRIREKHWTPHAGRADPTTKLRTAARRGMHLRTVSKKAEPLWKLPLAVDAEPLPVLNVKVLVGTAMGRPRAAVASRSKRTGSATAASKDRLTYRRQTTGNWL